MAELLVKWKSEYALGLDEIDHQHELLIELINRTWQAIVARAGQPAVLALLGELEKYTIAHFSAEEAFMRATGYPDFAAHKKAHQSFIERVALERQNAAEGGHLSLDLTHFLKDWLVDHILVTDKAYAAHTAKRPADSSLGRFFKRFW